VTCACLLSLLLACPRMPQSSDWTIVRIDGVATTGAPTISFTDGGISGPSGCNGFKGQAEVAGGILQLAPALAMARRACPGTNLSMQDTRLRVLLQGDVQIKPGPADDSLTLAGNGVSARLVSGPSQTAISSAAYVIVSDVETTLNTRNAVTTSSGVVTQAPFGIILRNERCEEGSDRTWCQIRFVDALGIAGWPAAEFLSPVSAIRRVGAELFDQTGRAECGTAHRRGAPEPISRKQPSSRWWRSRLMLRSAPIAAERMVNDICKVTEPASLAAVPHCTSSERSRPSPQVQPTNIIERKGCGTKLPLLSSVQMSAIGNEPIG